VKTAEEASAKFEAAVLNAHHEAEQRAETERKRVERVFETQLSALRDEASSARNKLVRPSIL
jgi:hypothetical protein